MNNRQGGSRTTQEFRTSLESLEFHQYQLDQWQRSIPDELQRSHADSTDTRSTLLFTVLHLRANQMRAFMIRPFLYAGTSIAAQLGKSSAAVDIAIDTIQTIADLHARSDFITRQQALFNYFLVSALGVLYALIIRETNRETSSVASDQLSPAGFAKAKSGLFCGLNILQSLGASATYPGRLWDKLFPFISQGKAFQNYDYGPESADYLSESPTSFPAAPMYDSPNNQSLLMNAVFPVSNSSVLDSRSQSTTQACLELDRNTVNLFESGEAYSADDVLLDTYFGQQFVNSFNDSTLAPPF